MIHKIEQQNISINTYGYYFNLFEINGKEFISNKFHELLKYNRITHLFSTPYTPQQNGKTEKLNGILISCATILLEDAQLRIRFWEDSVSTASYLYSLR